MKKVMLSALVAGMFMFGSVYAQTATPVAGKPEMKQESVGAGKSEKSAKGHKKHKGKKPAATKAATTAPKAETKPADKK